MLKIMGKKIFTILHWKILFIKTYATQLALYTGRDHTEFRG